MGDFTSRTLDQEPDTIALIPNLPDYVVIGTYSLATESTDENKGVPAISNSGGRKGSLQILPFFSSRPRPEERSASSADVSLARKDFPFGVYDVRFHPQYRGLLGVATSNAEILFFDVRIKYTPTGALESVDFAEIGKVLVEEPSPDESRLAIITQFRFLTSFEDTVQSSISESATIYLIATSQFGNTLLSEVVVGRPAIDDSTLQILDSQIMTIHQQSYNLEAWTALPIYADPSNLHILSGGDDNHLIVSSVHVPAEGLSAGGSFDLDLLISRRVLADKRTHQAGIVDICSLNVGSFSSPSGLTDSSSFLVLTGSYDESLRLFRFSPSTPSHPKTEMILLSEIALGGGVWRIILMDAYDTQTGKDFILLVAAHTAGACIVRLSCAVTGNGEILGDFTVEKWFKEGHQSLVYAVIGKRHANKTNVWQVISASFYDRKICEWEWADQKTH